MWFRVIVYLCLVLTRLFIQAGACAGLSINLVLYPFDTLKTRIQAPWYHKVYGTIAGRNPALYHGLYQGVGTVLIFSVPSAGVFFSTYEASKHALYSTQLPAPVVQSISSAIAQVITSTVVIPGEVIKQNAQVRRETGMHRSKARFSSLMIAQDILKTQPSGLWKGYWALMLRDLPFTALQFPMLEHMKGVLMERSRLRKLARGDNTATGLTEHVKIAALSGSLAGSIAAWITTPADVVKTRLILKTDVDNRGQHNTATTRPLASHDRAQMVKMPTIRMFGEIWANEGVTALFRGGLIRVMWTAVGNGLFIGCYEGARVMLQSKATAFPV